MSKEQGTGSKPGENEQNGLVTSTEVNLPWFGDLGAMTYSHMGVYQKLEDLRGVDKVRNVATLLRLKELVLLDSTEQSLGIQS